MEYTLSEQEYKNMTPRAPHDKQCIKYREQLNKLKKTEKELLSQYKKQYPKPSGESKAGHLSALLEDVNDNTRKSILALVEKQGGIIRGIEFGIFYFGENNEILEGSVESINSKGNITIEGKPPTSIDKITSDPLYGLFDIIYDNHIQKNSEKQKNNQ